MTHSKNAAGNAASFQLHIEIIANLQHHAGRVDSSKHAHTAHTNFVQLLWRDVHESLFQGIFEQA